jgi:D-glycero-D-manno-heptose 1,7-bisphosphate phosphatase
MIEKALAKHKLDASRCVMVGDKERDIKAAEGAGVRGILTATNSPLEAILAQIC